MLAAVWSAVTPRHLIRTVIAGGLLVSVGLSTGLAPSASPAAASSTVPSVDHLFLIVEENNGFRDVIGNSAAPNLNNLADRFGLATDYFGVNGTSEPNYVGLLGGSTFGLNSDDPYWLNRVHAPSLISQLDAAGISWKAYLQGLPHPDYEDICYPTRCNGAPDTDPLYVSKHDGIQNFTTSLNSFDWSHQVPIEQLQSDLSSGAVPRFSYIVPDECHDMHGDPPYCLDSGNEGDAQNQHLIAFGDAYLGQLVSSITNAPFWSQGNNAIAITFDSGDNSAGCCDAKRGGGHVATVVVTSHGPRGVTDATPSNHFSLLQTIQDAFGLGCLQFTCDTARVHPLAPLFTETGSPAVATSPLTPPDVPTPTPTPTEPLSTTTATPSAGGWTVQRAGLLGRSDNSLGAVAAASPSDVWAVGDYLPDASGANPDATLTFAEHYDGTRWKVVPTPNVGPNFGVLFDVAASQGRAWAVGSRLDDSYDDRALVESWDGSAWSVDDVPQPGSLRDMLSGVSATSPSDVWAVGTQEGADGRFQGLAEHFDGTTWSAVTLPEPGTIGIILYGVDAVSSDDVWAVGQRVGPQGPDQPLVEHWDGRRWTVADLPTVTSGTAMLNSVAAGDGQVWAVGQVDDPLHGGRPLIEHFDGSAWHTEHLGANIGSRWTSLWGVAVSGTTAWAVGTFVNPVTDNNLPLVLESSGGHWRVDDGPVPGTGSNILGGVTASQGQLWAAGVYDNGGSERPFVEHH
jgi:hypothetical protein